MERQADALKQQYARITGPEALEAINAYIAESRDSLNPVISRLLNNKLKPDEEAWQTYAEKHPASCAAYIISLSE